MAVKSSLTFSAVFALVSKNSSPASLAYASASPVGTARLSGCSATRSALFPASAMMIFSFACLCSSFTQALALSNDACQTSSAVFKVPDGFLVTYCLRDVVHHYCTIGISVVHGG